MKYNFQNYNEIDYHRNPAGDFGKNINGAHVFNWMQYSNGCNILNKHSLNCEFIKNAPITTTCSQSVDMLLCQCSDNDCSKSVEAYHCYCLNILLIAIKSMSSKLAEPNIEIRYVPFRK